MRISSLHLATSADVGAGASRVVGYGAFAFEYSASARLAEADRELLLSACMSALGEAARNGGKPEPAEREPEVPPALSSWRATFVTLSENGQLRGCIGSPAPRRPLVEDAAANAAQAGFADPRFPPLSESGLAGLRLDVSILSHPRPVPAESESMLAGALEPDHDGLILGVGRAAPCSCRASGVSFPTRAHSCVIWSPRPASKRQAGRRGWRRCVSASNHSALRGDQSKRERSRKREARTREAECPSSALKERHLLKKSRCAATD